MLMTGGFRLRKWISDESSVLTNIPESDKIESIVNMPTDISVCLLGVVWNPAPDCFSYNVQGAPSKVFLTSAYFVNGNT